ncbi:hypothetical protein ACV3RS_15845 [Clostridium perfringens]
MEITFEYVLSEFNISNQDILDLKIELHNAKKGEIKELDIRFLEYDNTLCDSKLNQLAKVFLY